VADKQTSLCFVTTCKGRLEHLQKSLPLMVTVPNTRCIVVDYGCPQQSGRWVLQHYPQVHVEFVTDDSEFCLSRARNFGANAVTSPWVCFIDADVMLQPEFAVWLRQPRDPKAFYGVGVSDSPTRGTMLSTTESFFSVGGYDEVIRGWGGEDDELYLRLRAAGNMELAFPAGLLSPIEHDDSLRTAFHPIKDRFLQHRINYLYTHLKSDIGRFSPEFLTKEGRRQIMAEASKTVLGAAAQSGAVHFEVELGDIAIPQLRQWGIRRKIIYDTSAVLDPVTPEAVRQTSIQTPATSAQKAPAAASPKSPGVKPVPVAENQIVVGNGRGLELILTVIPGETTQALAKEIFVNGCYAAPTPPTPPSAIVDIGAGVGLTSAYFRLIHPEANIYCFESDAAALAVLRTNVDVIGKAEVNPQASTTHVTGNATALDALAFLPKIDILKLSSVASNLPILSSLRPRLTSVDTIYVEYSGVTTRDKTTALLGEALRASHQLWKVQALGGEKEVRGVLIYARQEVAAKSEK
jgi:N-terminal domain of galactosyltransferase/Glycosyl transferase family 2/Methyltransferase small domain